MATPGGYITVGSQPGITIKHPMVERGQAWELLRSTPAAADVSHLELLGNKHATDIRSEGVADGCALTTARTRTSSR